MILRSLQQTALTSSHLVAPIVGCGALHAFGNGNILKPFRNPQNNRNARISIPYDFKKRHIHMPDFNLGIGSNIEQFISLSNNSNFGTLALGVVMTGLISARYKVAEANEYIVRTGIFIDDIDISKRALRLF